MLVQSVDQFQYARHPHPDHGERIGGKIGPALALGAAVAASVRVAEKLVDAAEVVGLHDLLVALHVQLERRGIVAHLGYQSQVHDPAPFSSLSRLPLLSSRLDSPTTCHETDGRADARTDVPRHRRAGGRTAVGGSIGRSGNRRSLRPFRVRRRDELANGGERRPERRLQEI